jgi:coenzyme F420-reducing hydrogenase alpha subunit
MKQYLNLSINGEIVENAVMPLNTFASAERMFNELAKDESKKFFINDKGNKCLFYLSANGNECIYILEHLEK